MNEKTLFYQLFICIGWFIYEDSVDWNDQWRAEIKMIFEKLRESDEKKC